jgi:fatty-acyl-CoA synthase
VPVTRDATAATGGNLADLWESVVARRPDATAVVQGDRRLTASELDRRADGIAAELLAAGLDRQDRVGLYLYNGPEYLEAYLAATKASLVPFNTNYRYLDDELVHLWTDADAAAVVFHGTFTAIVDRIRHRVPTVRRWLWVDDGADPCPEWATSYERAALTDPRPAPWPRSDDDLIFVYTGGTTGLPKGVMWRQSALLEGIGVVDAVHRPVPALPAAPLMHGTGAMAAVHALLTGGSVVLLSGRRFDPIELLDAVQREQVASVTIVGDAFARPVLAALDEEPDRWDLRSLRGVTSAGAMFSEPVKRGLLRHAPQVRLFDLLGSSENGGAGRQMTAAERRPDTATFVPHDGVRVLDEAGQDVEPGSGRPGAIAIPGGADGYHKDPAKTARTFPVIDGRRYTVSGDYATVDPDGTLRLLGRGSVCINTGGEKVFPEEVEEALKTHVAVRDAIVVGVPDERFGEVVTAVVEVGTEVGDVELIDHVKARLAPYKAPRHVVRVASVGRAPNGKADYQGTRALACARLAPEGTTR